MLASDQGVVEAQRHRLGLTRPSPITAKGAPRDPYSQRQPHAGYKAGCPSGTSAPLRQSR